MITDPNRRLEEIYIERNNEYIALEKSGLTREEILPRLEHYQEEIDAIVWPNGKKKIEPPNIGDVFGIYKLIGNNNGYCCKSSDTTINGKAAYNRLFIRKVGEQTYQGCGEYILDMEPEEIENYIYHKAVFLTMRIQKGWVVKKIKVGTTKTNDRKATKTND